MSLRSEFRSSLDYCQETCPDVNGAFDGAWQQLRECVAPVAEKDAAAILEALCAEVKKVGTEKLREALCSAVRDKLDVEQERDQLSDKVSDLESQVDDLQSQIESLEQELAEVTP